MFTIGVITLSGLLLLFAGIILPHFLAKERAKRERFIESSQEFRNSFEKEVVHIRQWNSIETYEVLRDAFERHQIAVNEFRLGLHGKTLVRFDEAWRNYHHNPNGKRLMQYMSTSNHNETEMRRKLAIKNLEAVLKFANPK